MIIKIDLLFIILVYLYLAVTQAFPSIDPPLWPQHFTQSFRFTGENGHLNSTAKLWYDYTSQLFRTDYDNGKDMQCQYQFQKITKCVELYRNKTMYLFMPNQNLCCHYKQQNPPQRDFLRRLNFTYTGQSQINNQSFYLWQSPLYPQNKYYATKDERMIPRKYALGTYVRDYVVTSYNDQQISPSVFNVPSYCQKACNGIKEKQIRNNQNEQKHSLYKYYAV